MSEIQMPRLSDTMQEGTISRWLKQQGDEVKKGDILAEIETDKATMDLESYDTGILEKILVQEGETVPIGQSVAVIGSGSGAQKQEQAAATRTDSGTQKQEQPAGTVADTGAQQQGQPADAKGRADGSRTAPADQSAQRASTGAGEGSDGKEARAIKASPLARRVAQEYNIDLRQVTGKGPGGRIERADIEDFREQQGAPTKEPSQPAAQQPQAPAQAAPSPVPSAQAGVPPDAEVITLSRVQTLIARRLTEAKQTIPHFYVSSEVDMTEALAMRQVLNASAGEDGVKVTVNDLIVKACSLALEKFPEVNSSFKDGQSLRYKHIHVGIAVDVPAGLVVPVIHDTNTKGVRTIARESKALIEKARQNKLTTSDLEGGTFSVSNLGMMDVTDFIAVINPPQAAILAIASTRKHFVPVDGQPVIRDLMSMTLSADHRILYGATVARFLQEVKRLLQSPYNILG